MGFINAVNVEDMTLTLGKGNFKYRKEENKFSGVILGLEVSM